MKRVERKAKDKLVLVCVADRVEYEVREALAHRHPS